MNNVVKLWDLATANELRSWNMSSFGQDGVSIAFSPITTTGHRQRQHDIVCPGIAVIIFTAR